MNIAVFFGGKSCEHEISIISGVQTLCEISGKHNVLPVYIDKNNEWFLPEDSKNVKSYINFKSKKKLGIDVGTPYITKNVFGKFKRFFHVDCAIICCHGMHGEDGTLAGLLELCDIPYSCPSVLSSALCMDKVFMKKMFFSGGFNSAKYITIIKNNYKNNAEITLQQIENQIGFPLIVKPANLGSSIGINKCNSVHELKFALEVAFSFDSKILIETFLENSQEINCAIVGNLQKKYCSNLQQPQSWQSFLTFEEKYLTSKKTKIQNNNIAKKLQNQIYKLSENLFDYFDCKGVIRIDYLVKDNIIYVNEINTIPGSLSFPLWDNIFSPAELINKLIELAIQDKIKKDENVFSYQSVALQNYKPSLKTKFNKLKK